MFDNFGGSERQEMNPLPLSSPIQTTSCCGQGNNQKSPLRYKSWNLNVCDIRNMFKWATRTPSVSG